MRVSVIVTRSFKTKSGVVHKRGQIIEDVEASPGLVTLLKDSYLQILPCSCCQRTAYWLSCYGVLICDTCHPAANEPLGIQRIKGEGHA